MTRWWCNNISIYAVCSIHICNICFNMFLISLLKLPGNSSNLNFDFEDDRPLPEFWWKLNGPCWGAPQQFQWRTCAGIFRVAQQGHTPYNVQFRTWELWGGLFGRNNELHWTFLAPLQGTIEQLEINMPHKAKLNNNQSGKKFWGSWLCDCAKNRRVHYLLIGT